MNCYIITYDIPNTAGNNYYDRLYNYLKSFKLWAWINNSTRAVKDYTNAVIIRNNLKQILPFGASIFVIKSGREAAWENTRCDGTWLTQNL